MIKWKHDRAVLLYRTDNEETHQQDEYIIDLSQHKFFLEDEELDWTADVTEYVRESQPDCIRYVRERIQNNLNVMRSTELEGNTFENEKATRHLAQNERLLEFIEAYVVVGVVVE